MPGLIDAHCHAYGIDLDLLKLESVPLSYVALVAARRLAAALARGFTTVRDPSGETLGLARAIAEGLLPSRGTSGPVLRSAKPVVTVMCVPPTVSCAVVRRIRSRWSTVVDPLRRAVRDRFRRGAHAIKIMASGVSCR